MKKLLGNCNDKLIVPLPMELSKYKKDFSTIESKEEFETLLNKASKTFELPWVEGNSSTKATFDLKISYPQHHTLPNSLKKILVCYASADILSLKFQSKYKLNVLAIKILKLCS